MSDAEITQEGTTEEAKPKLNLSVDIAEKSACQRHVTVTVPREDVDRYLSEAFDEIRGKAEVPGFRPGRAPRKLVESRFKEQVMEQVKGSLLMDSLQQVNEDHELSAISEPDLDVDAVVIPDEGPMTFEFDLEVRPDFEVPDWKGLELKRPVHEYTSEEVDHELKGLLRRYSELVPHDGPAEAGDFVVVNVRFTKDGKQISRIEEETIPVRPVLSFPDARYEGFEELVAGCQAGDRKTFQVTISAEAENEALRGETVDAELEVLDVKRLEFPELKGEFLERIGGFEDEDDLRDAVREELERQLQYHQQREIRNQIMSKLTASANWDLPPELLKRQYRRELDRAVLELRSAGFSDEAIRQHENTIRQNSLASTKRALQEHFILERIAEQEEIDATPEDFDAEIVRIAEQSDESPRRVRARLEKRDQMDVLRNQIIERMVIGLIVEHAKVETVEFEPPKDATAAVNHRISGKEDAQIPEAKHGGQAEELRSPVDRT